MYWYRFGGKQRLERLKSALERILGFIDIKEMHSSRKQVPDPVQIIDIKEPTMGVWWGVN